MSGLKQRTCVWVEENANAPCGKKCGFTTNYCSEHKMFEKFKCCYLECKTMCSSGELYCEKHVPMRYNPQGYIAYGNTPMTYTIQMGVPPPPPPQTPDYPLEKKIEDIRAICEGCRDIDDIPNGALAALYLRAFGGDVGRVVTFLKRK